MRKSSVFIMTGLAGAFLLGLGAGMFIQIGHREDDRALRQAAQTTIAVVNVDAGVEIDGDRQNFAAAIIETLGDSFVLVSPAMADTGFNQGIYGAIVTFPATVSARVLSFNTRDPQRVRLEYQINPLLAEEAYLETYLRISDLQQSINAMLAHTFVSSVFGQFHLAQDYVEAVFQNDMSTIEALDILSFQNFTAGLHMDEIPAVPFTPNVAVTDHFFLSFVDFADGISDIYRGSYAEAAADYLAMRERLILLTDDFPRQEEAWLSELAVWADISVEYGESLAAYAKLAETHMDELMKWHAETMDWSEAAAGYEATVREWAEMAEAHIYETDAMKAQKELMEYWHGVNDYLDGLVSYRGKLGNMDEVGTALSNWHTALEEYVAQMEDFPGNPLPPRPTIPVLTMPEPLPELPDITLPVKPSAQIIVGSPFPPPPGQLAAPPVFGGTLPDNPLIPPPPKPDGFWAALDEKHGLLNSFDIAGYLTDSHHAQVEAILERYDAYLGVARDDLATQFDANTEILYGAYRDYSGFLADLREETRQAEADGIAHLHNRIGGYFDIAHANSADTHGNLHAFANMIPESRVPAGVNHGLVNFTVAPFEAVPPAVRMKPPNETKAGPVIWRMAAAWSGAGFLVLAALGIAAGYLKGGLERRHI